MILQICPLYHQIHRGKTGLHLFRHTVVLIFCIIMLPYSVTYVMQAVIACDYAREQVQERVTERIAICEEGGAEVVEVSDELREQIREASTDLYEEIRAVVDDDELYEMYVNGQ